MKAIFEKIKNKNEGAVALLLVIMITALTVISVVVVSMTNVSDLMSAYYFSEAEEVDVDLDACLDDAMFRLASTTDATGTYYLAGVGTNCYYQISADIVGGLKTVTSTASTTSSIGYWEDTVVVRINVSSTPISVYSYKNSNSSFASYLYCGDGACNDSETAVNCSADCADSCGDTYCTGSENASTCPGDCSASCGDTYCTHTETCSSCVGDCGACAVCGNGTTEGDEVCDDGPEACGDGVVQNGTFCNSSCSGTYTVSEGCDYTSLSPCGNAGSPSTASVGCSKNPLCDLKCTSCTKACF
jgi:hypothetical protein